MTNNERNARPSLESRLRHAYQRANYRCTRRRSNRKLYSQACLLFVRIGDTLLAEQERLTGVKPTCSVPVITNIMVID